MFNKLTIQKYGLIISFRNCLHKQQNYEMCKIEFSAVSDIPTGDGTYKLANLFNETLPGPPIVVYKGQQVNMAMLYWNKYGSNALYQSANQSINQSVNQSVGRPAGF